MKATSEVKGNQSTQPTLHEILDIDADDIEILTLLQADPTMPHADIAARINKSQPAVGARVLKLERKGLLVPRYGVNLTNANLVLAVVRLYARNSKSILDSVSCCPHVLAAFSTLGATNVTAWLVGTSLDKIESIIEMHFRSNPDVRHVEMAVVMDTITDLVLPVDFNLERVDSLECGPACHARAREQQVASSAEGGDDIMETPAGAYKPETGSELGKILGIDDIDKQIIMYLQEDSWTTHGEIGESVGRSQPTIGSRVSKLVERGLLRLQKGVNFKDVKEIFLVQVAISARDSSKVIEHLSLCPNVIAGFRTTSENSIVVYLGGTSLDEIEIMVDACIRMDENVNEVETMPVLAFDRDLVLPFNFACDFSPEIGCSGCSYCTGKLIRSMSAGKSVAYKGVAGDIAGAASEREPQEIMP